MHYSSTYCDQSLNANAYAQRQPSKSKKLAPHNELPFSESLPVSYWSSDLEEVNDTLVMKDEKFIILSSTEDDLHLVEEAKFHRKAVMDICDSTSGGNGESNDYFLLRTHSNLVQVRSELLDGGENEERVFDEGGVVKLDDGECRNNEETNIGDHQGIKEGRTPTPLNDPCKPDCPISLDLNDKEGEKPDVNDSSILKDICMDSLPVSQPIWSLDGYNTDVSDDLGPQAAISGMCTIISCGCSE